MISRSFATMIRLDGLLGSHLKVLDSIRFREYPFFAMGSIDSTLNGSVCRAAKKQILIPGKDKKRKGRKSKKNYK